MLIRPSAWEADALPTELLPHSQNVYYISECKCNFIFLKYKSVTGVFSKIPEFIYLRWYNLFHNPCKSHKSHGQETGCN